MPSELSGWHIEDRRQCWRFAGGLNAFRHVCHEIIGFFGGASQAEAVTVLQKQNQLAATPIQGQNVLGRKISPALPGFRSNESQGVVG